jgi:hypothetical protein
MKYLENDIASFYYSDPVFASISKICTLIKTHPFLLEPVKELNEKAGDILSREGFLLYPTVKTTTLFYDRMTDCFFKSIHPLTMKNKLVFHITDKASRIYKISECLITNGINVPKIEAYGKILKTGEPFFVVRRMEGRSLYDILIRQREAIDIKIYLNIMDEMVRLHKLGFWLGDAHLSHVFVHGSGFSGFIDIDSIRKNKPFSSKKLAKDIAGLNHPELPITKDEKKMLLQHYIKAVKIKNEKRFLKQLKHYTEQRWKGSV